MERPKKPQRGTQKAKKPTKRKKETYDGFQTRLATWVKAEEALDAKYVHQMAQYEADLLAFNTQQESIKSLRGKKRMSAEEASTAAKGLLGKDGKLVAKAEEKAAKLVSPDNPKKK